MGLAPRNVLLVMMAGPLVNLGQQTAQHVPQATRVCLTTQVVIHALQDNFP